MITSKICKYIVPQSVTNADYEKYEFFLVWQDANGGVCSWLFEDFTSKKEVSGDVINSNSENITKVFKESTNKIFLVAEDLTENEFDVLSSIVNAKIVRRYFKNNSYVNLAILTSEVIKKHSQYNYTFEVEVQQINDNILK